MIYQPEAQYALWSNNRQAYVELFETQIFFGPFVTTVFYSIEDANAAAHFIDDNSLEIVEV